MCVYICIYVCMYIYIYICIHTCMYVAHRAPPRSGRAPGPLPAVDIELCHLYPYPCPKKFYKLPAVLFCYTILFYKLAWVWAWV